MAIPALKGRLTWILLLSIATGCLAASPVHGAEKQPQILVRFEVASTTITDALPNQGARIEAERALADYLAKRMRAQFPFVAWTAVESAAGPVVGQLVARLIEDTADPMSSISVQWLAVRPPGSTPVPLILAPIEIYKKNDPNVATDTKGLQQDAQRALDRVALVALSDAGFMRDFFTVFVSTIPLAVSVTAVPAKRVIELPLKGDELPIGQESEMKVEFLKTGAGDVQKGLIKLSRFAPMASGKLGGGVNQAVVNQTALELTQNWHPAIPALLNGTPVQCFLTSYKPDSSLPRIITVPQ